MKVTKRKAKGVLADMIADMDEDSLARTREKMERITEDYCSQEVVKLLKEKGFPFGYNKWVEEDAPTLISQSIVCKWLRKKGVNICPDISDNGKWFYMIVRNFSKEEIVNGTIGERRVCGYFDAYEDCIEAALKHALENLI